MGKNRDADPESKNDLGVHDDLGEEIEAAQRVALERELKQFTTQLEDTQKEKARYSEQWGVDNELYQMMIEKNSKVPEHQAFEYEKEPRYWELRKTQLGFKYEMDKHLAESRIKGYDKISEEVQEQIDSATKKISELDGDKNE